MPRIQDEHHQRGGDGLPVPSHNGSGPAENVSPETVTIRPERTSTGIRLVRYGLPAAIFLAGVVIVIVVPGSAGVEGIITMLGICLCVALFNSLVRLGASSDVDRDKEEAARDQYERTGIWPDDRRRKS